MEIISIKPRSYCRGVVLAIQKAIETKEKNPDKNVSLLGHLVHNKLVSQALAAKGIHTLDQPGLSRLELLEHVPLGIVIFSAHGVSDSVRRKALELGLEVVDATCPEVQYTQELVKQKTEAGYHVLYVGKKGHPEAIAVTEELENAHLIEDVADLDELRDIGSRIFVTNQTTLSYMDLDDVFVRIRTLYPNAEFANEICSATRMRQNAVRKRADIDILLVVGDPHSNNTAMLAKIGEGIGIPQVHRIESAESLDLAWFRPDSRVGVTSGASTPPALIQQVEEYLRTLDLENPTPPPPVQLGDLLNAKA